MGIELKNKMSMNIKKILLLALTVLNIFCSPIEKVNHFDFGQTIIPSPEKRNGGEDAVYSSSNVLVVADGVGGWSRRGIDSGKYSRMLCSFIEKFSNEATQSSEDIEKH